MCYLGPGRVAHFNFFITASLAWSLEVYAVTMFRKLRVLCGFRSLVFNYETTVKKFAVQRFDAKVDVPFHRCFAQATVPSPKPPSDDFFQHVDYDALTRGDDNLLKKLKLIMLEIDVMRQEGQKVPKTITLDKWKELLDLPSRSQRCKLLGFWFLNEMKKASDKAKKLKRQQERKLKDAEKFEQLDNQPDDGRIRYGFQGSTIFLRIYDSAIDKWRNSRLIEAMMFGQPIVIDCSYDEYMNVKEASNAALQLSYVFAENRMHVSPFNLYFCNARKDSRMVTKLHKAIPTMYNDDFPVNVSEKSYLDIFPKERLVYLTPHCREELRTYNHDDVYIIGAMVDKVNCEPLSMAKAKAEGLRMAKLPLDRYLDWGLGTKSLTINQVLNIMLDVKVYNDWSKALCHVPRRKIKEEGEPSKKNRKLISMRELYC